MADASRQEQWEHTSWIVATIINVNRDPKTQPIQPNTINPMPKKKKQTGPKTVGPKVGVGVLKSLFIDKKVGKRT